MKTISMYEFLSMLDNYKSTTDITVTEHDVDNVFSITINEDKIFLEIPKGENKYDFLFEEIDGKFSKEYKIICNYFNPEKPIISMAIKDKINIFFDYSHADGKKWLYLNT